MSLWIKILAYFTFVSLFIVGFGQIFANFCPETHFKQQSTELIDELLDIVQVSRSTFESDLSTAKLASSGASYFRFSANNGLSPQLKQTAKAIITSKGLWRSIIIKNFDGQGNPAQSDSAAIYLDEQEINKTMQQLSENSTFDVNKYIEYLIRHELQHIIDWYHAVDHLLEKYYKKACAEGIVDKSRWDKTYKKFQHLFEWHADLRAVNDGGYACRQTAITYYKNYQDGHAHESESHPSHAQRAHYIANNCAL